MIVFSFSASTDRVQQVLQILKLLHQPQLQQLRLFYYYSSSVQHYAL
uniref:Uncharacterized protein n=1 Tax=Arundo donax TaxID=35708 RepID=A0A0A9CGN1_ARUDO